MCLVAVSLGQHPRFPLVLASNRDEFFDREAAPLAWWQPPGFDAPVLSGRDLSAGGIWFGLTAAGRLALLTNVRAPGALRPEAPSRGGIALDWLRGGTSADAFAQHHLGHNYSGFNALTADLAGGDWQWFSNHPPARRRLEPGLWGLSNAAFDTPWPKVERLKRAVSQAISEATADSNGLAEALFAALADRTPAASDQLPDTGIPPEREARLSSPFIHIPAEALGRAYGTRCSTLLIVENHGGQRRALLRERRFDAAGRASGEVEHLLPDWPGAA